MKGRDGLTLERKSMPIVAWYMLSNESYMNRVMREVLPTARRGVSYDCHDKAFVVIDVPLCSPKNTSLKNHCQINHTARHRERILEFLQGVVIRAPCLRHAEYKSKLICKYNLGCIDGQKRSVGVR